MLKYFWRILILFLVVNQTSSNMNIQCVHQPKVIRQRSSGPGRGCAGLLALPLPTIVPPRSLSPGPASCGPHKLLNKLSNIWLNCGGYKRLITHLGTKLIQSTTPVTTSPTSVPTSTTSVTSSPTPVTTSTTPEQTNTPSRGQDSLLPSATQGRLQAHTVMVEI